MLGAVLDELTAWQGCVGMPSYWAEACRISCDDTGVTAQHPPAWSGPSVTRLAWLTTDPAEAWELLQARGLIPLGYEGRFVCEGCEGVGKGRFPSITTEELARGENWFRYRDCDDRDATGHRPHPPTVAALASWLSLGWVASDDGAHPGILGAEELARAIVPDVAPLWRVRVLQQAPRVPRDASPADRLLRAGIEAVDIGCTRLTLALYVPPLGGRS